MLRGTDFNANRGKNLGQLAMRNAECGMENFNITILHSAFSILHFLH